MKLFWCPARLNQGRQQWYDPDPKQPVASPLQVWRVAVKVVRDRAVVDAAPGHERLDVVLRDVLGDAHRAKDALAVICGQSPHRLSGFENSTYP